MTSNSPIDARGQAAFDHRVLASACFFATDIHSATLGKGKSDDSLIRVRRGDLTGKGELVVRTIITLHVRCESSRCRLDDIWKTGYPRPSRREGPHPEGVG
jgi:hypothetical protein